MTAMLDDRYDSFDDDFYHENHDIDFEDEFEEDVEGRCDYILSVIEKTRKLRDLNPVERIILDLLEEIVELL